MSKLFIGISGKMGSGKTTLTNGLLKYFKGTEVNRDKCSRISLAKPIKDCQDLIYKQLGMTMEGEKDRDLLIALGMWGRDKDSDFWLNKAIEVAKSSEDEIIICDDIRFENEANWFRDNGVLMRIHGVQRGDNVDHNINNKTETALDDYAFPYYIDNRNEKEGTISDALFCILQYINRANNLRK